MTKRRWFILGGVVATISTFQGCTTGSEDLMRNGYLRLQDASQDRRVRAIWFSAREQDHSLVFSGMLKQTLRYARPIKAHVDITVHYPDGTVFAEGRSQNLYVPQNRIGAGPDRLKQFSVRFDSLPPPNSVLQIVVHRGTHG